MSNSKETQKIVDELRGAGPFLTSNDINLITRNKYELAAKKLRSKSLWVILGALVITIIFLLNSVFAMFGFLQTFTWMPLALAFLWFWLGASILIWSLKKFSALRSGVKLLQKAQSNTAE